MVSSGEWQTIQDSFHVAVQLPEIERVEYVKQLTLSNTLKAHLQKLIEADNKSTSQAANLKQEISKTITDITIPEIENYDISEKIASGGMGEVFKARDLKLSRDVAIKILHHHRSQDKKYQQRFLREARAAAKIRHENICPVFDVSTTNDGIFYIVSAFCEGESLAHKINNNSLSYEMIFSVFEQLLNALGTAHSEGIIHRDLKPDNIIVDKNNRIQLVDFGIAKNFDDLQTQSGDVLGTPDYMPPEQFRGEAFDHRSDIWSCGIILYELLLGFTPYQGKSAPEIIYSMLHENIPVAADSKDPLFPFFRLIQDCLEIDKSLRLANIDNLLQKLLEAKQGLESNEILDKYPDYQISSDQITNTEEQLVKQTARDFVILQLQIVKGSLNESHHIELKAIASKHKGYIQETHKGNNKKLNTLLVIFGYPLADELKVENAKQCGQLFSDLLTKLEMKFSLLADINIAIGDKNNFTSNVIPQEIIDGTEFLLKQLDQSGLWLSEGFTKRLRNYDSLIQKSLTVKDKFGSVHTCHFISNSIDNNQSTTSFDHSHFIGRETQLSFFVENWEQAKEGDQQRIMISGEAGIGKSRLIYEFKKEITDFEKINLIELDCSPYEKASTYFPILEFLQKQIVLESNSVKKPSEKILLAYLKSRIDASKTEQLLFFKLMNVDLSPNDQASLPTGDLLNRKYQDLIIRLLTSKSEHQTSLYIIEDLHWLDTATGIIIEKLLQPSSTSQSLIVMSSRPEFKPLWLSNLVTSNLYLSKLRANHSEKLLKSLIKDYSQNTEEDDSTEKLIPKLIERAGGNPLFIEEMAKTFSDFDANQIQAEQHIPETIQDSLIARLERIGAAQSLAQHASVIGRDFNLDVLRLCQPIAEADFKQQLHTLIQADIIQSTNTQHQYRFKHALIRDAAYQMITTASRQSLHRNLASTLESHFSDIVETQPELLAQHWEAAELLENAIQYWLIAAQRNLQLSATDECISNCDHIVELAAQNQDPKLSATFKLQTLLIKGVALMTRYGYADQRVKEVYSEALGLCDELEETKLKFPVLYGLWTYHCVKAEHLNAEKLTKKMVQLCESMAPVEKCIAYGTTGMTQYYLGQFEQAQNNFSLAIGFHQESDVQNFLAIYGHNFKVVIQSYQSWNESILGNIEAAISISSETVFYAKELNHPFSLTYGLSFAAWLNLNLGNAEGAELLIKDSIKVCKEYDIAVFLGLSMSLYALILFSQGKLEEGEKMMAEAEDIYLSTGSLLFIPSFLTAKAEVALLLEDIQSAEAFLEQSLQLIEGTIEEWGLGATLALKSVVHAKKQEMEQASELMQLATEKINQQKAQGLKAMLLQKGIPFET